MLGVYGESSGVIIMAIGRRLVEATGEPREANRFNQNLAIAVQRANAFSIAGRERFLRVGGVDLYPTPHFVPEGISSSMSDFIVLVFNFEIFHIKFYDK